MLHSSEDLLFIRCVPQGILQDFRQETYTQNHVRKHWQKFLTVDWVVLDNKTEDLRAFLREVPIVSKEVQRNASDAAFVREISQGTLEDFRREVYTKTHIEKNWDKFLTADWVLLDNKLDDLKRFVEEGAHGLVALPEEEIEVDVLPDLATRIGCDNAVGNGRGEASGCGTRLIFPTADDEMAESEELSCTATAWLDLDVTSNISFYPRKLKVNRQLSVDETEAIIGLPSYYPVPRTKRIYILDLRDEKYKVYDHENKLIPLDAIVKDKDQDSWRGGTGKGDSRTTVTIFGDGRPVQCRRSRLRCSGVWACEKVDHKLVDCARYELDAASLQGLVDAQVESRHKEADTAEKLAILFFAVCQTRTCPAKDRHKHACSGQPILRTNDTGKRPFIGCSGFSKKFSDGHRSDTIPDNVNLQDLAILFSGGTLGGIDDRPTCTRIVPAHIGGRIKRCKMPHNSDGTLSELKRRPCPARRTLFIPLDPTIRMVAISYDHRKPHNHPILPATKTSREVRDLYLQCISAAGLAGSTVLSIETAPSTRLILGKTPSMVAPALQDHAVKARMLTKAKKKAFPFGVGIEGVTHLQSEDTKNLPIQERYIHCIKKTVSGADIVFTANPYLLSRIHKASTIEVDTTFKRVVGDLKEWEVVMWDPEVFRALTVARVYTNRADTIQYKMIFDELQIVTLQLTGKRLLLKALSQGGTLLSIGVDLELAQALGAGQSFLPTNEPEYSGIPTTVTPEELIMYFVRACLVHFKRGIRSLKEWVSKADYERLMNLPYLETQEELDAFDTWIRTMGNVKVTAWWEHKVNNVWIIPAIVKFKSKIKAEDWDKTPPSTNMNEGQHHHTTSNTGVGLSLLEGIVRARELDEQTAAEVQQSLALGVLKNGRNDLYTRTSRSLGRASTASRKSRDALEQDAVLDSVREQINSLTQVQRENAAKIKQLKGKIVASNPRRRRGITSYKAESNSSGKIRVTPKATARRAKKVNAAVTINSDFHASDGPCAAGQPARGEFQSVPPSSPTLPSHVQALPVATLGGSRKRRRASEVDDNDVLPEGTCRKRVKPKRFTLE